MPTTHTPRTALELRAALKPYGPTVEDEVLDHDLDPPADLEPVLAVLHTGVRAVLSGRRWWATVEGQKAGRFTRVQMIVLNPGEPIQAGTTLLCVEGDPGWDRIDPVDHLDLPDLFAM
jgi:hypothetical protein